MTSRSAKAIRLQVAIRFHVAQHCYLAHIDFHMGTGLAALKDIGNEAEDLHFYDGQIRHHDRKPSPGWQFTLLDSTFERQFVAAISEHEAGLTLIHDTFHNEPTAIDIDPGYSEELWVKDSRFDNIYGPRNSIRQREESADRDQILKTSTAVQREDLRLDAREWKGVYQARR